MPLNLKRLLGRGPEKILSRDIVIREFPLVELGMTLVYILLAGAWFLFADDVLDSLMGDPRDSAPMHALKGSNFILTTSIVLYVVLRGSFRRRRLAEEAARLNQERFEGVALATTDAIWDLNLDTKVIWWSDGMQRLAGCRPEEISNRLDWWLERLHPDDRERVIGLIGQVRDSGGSTWSGHYRFRRQDGTYAHVYDRGYIIRDSAGKPLRVVGGMSDVTERRRAEEALENSRRQLRGLSARLQSTREEERAKVAREIHDELGQLLTALKLNLDWLERKLGAEDAGPRLNALLDRVVESAEIADSAITSVQQIATDLRPSLLDELGLAAALEQETQRFQTRSGLRCSLELPPEMPELSRETATAVFRIFQEALTNIARHAEASSVRVSLRVAAGEPVILEVEDDGKGIPPEAINNPRSVGLLGMRERAAVLGGDVAFMPATPRGTLVRLRLPATANDVSFWANL